MYILCITTCVSVCLLAFVCFVYVCLLDCVSVLVLAVVCVGVWGACGLVIGLRLQNLVCVHGRGACLWLCLYLCR